MPKKTKLNDLVIMNSLDRVKIAKDSKVISDGMTCLLNHQIEPHLDDDVKFYEEREYVSIGGQQVCYLYIEI